MQVRQERVRIAEAPTLPTLQTLQPGRPLLTILAIASPHTHDEEIVLLHSLFDPLFVRERSGRRRTRSSTFAPR